MHHGVSSVDQSVPGHIEHSFARVDNAVPVRVEEPAYQAVEQHRYQFVQQIETLQQCTGLRQSFRFLFQQKVSRAKYVIPNVFIIVNLIKQGTVEKRSIFGQSATTKIGILIYASKQTEQKCLLLVDLPYQHSY